MRSIDKSYSMILWACPGFCGSRWILLTRAKDPLCLGPTKRGWNMKKNAIHHSTAILRRGSPGASWYPKPRLGPGSGHGFSCGEKEGLPQLRELYIELLYIQNANFVEVIPNIPACFLWVLNQGFNFETCPKLSNIKSIYQSISIHIDLEIHHVPYPSISIPFQSISIHINPYKTKLLWKSIMFHIHPYQVHINT